MNHITFMDPTAVCCFRSVIPVCISRWVSLPSCFLATCSSRPPPPSCCIGGVCKTSAAASADRSRTAFWRRRWSTWHLTKHEDAPLAADEYCTPRYPYSVPIASPRATESDVQSFEYLVLSRLICENNCFFFLKLYLMCMRQSRHH